MFKSGAFISGIMFEQAEALSVSMLSKFIASNARLN